MNTWPSACLTENSHAGGSELKSIRETGHIRVVDLIFVTKAADGAVVIGN